MSDGIMELRSLNCDWRNERVYVNKNLEHFGPNMMCLGIQMRSEYLLSYLSHHSDGSFSCGLSHTVLHQVEHVLIVQKANEVERAKTGSAAQSQVPDDHRTTGNKGKHII